MKFIGIDVHKHICTAVVIDENNFPPLWRVNPLGYGRRMNESPMFRDIFHRFRGATS